MALCVRIGVFGIAIGRTNDPNSISDCSFGRFIEVASPDAIDSPMMERLQEIKKEFLFCSAAYSVT